MLGHNGFDFLAVLTFPLAMPGPLAYVGLGPGQELIPYFFALLGVIGTAIIAVLQWPVSALLRFLRAKGGPKDGLNAPPAMADAPEKPEEGIRKVDGAMSVRPLSADAPEKTGECTHDQP